MDSRLGLMFVPQRWRLDGIGSVTIDVSATANG
jgi:hypothetical protein